MGQVTIDTEGSLRTGYVTDSFLIVQSKYSLYIDFGVKKHYCLFGVKVFFVSSFFILQVVCN